MNVTASPEQSLGGFHCGSNGAGIGVGVGTALGVGVGDDVSRCVGEAVGVGVLGGTEAVGVGAGAAIDVGVWGGIGVSVGTVATVGVDERVALRIGFALGASVAPASVRLVGAGSGAWVGAGSTCLPAQAVSPSTKAIPAIPRTNLLDTPALLRNVTRQPLKVGNERIFPRQAEVVTSQEVIGALAGA